MIFVASSLESGLSMWVKKECLLSSLLSFGKPVGGLKKKSFLPMVCKFDFFFFFEKA